MLELCTLASGSSGNCLLASDGTTHLLIDAGISARRICKSLRALGVEPAGLSGILITHEHSDHIGGLATLTKQLRLPVYASRGTALPTVLSHRLFGGRDPSLSGRRRLLHRFVGDHQLPHPPRLRRQCGLHPHRRAPEGCGGHRLGPSDARRLRRDRGGPPAGVRGQSRRGVAALRPLSLFSQAAHSGGPGPSVQRGGAALACAAVEGGAQTVVLAHLSAENNTPVRAYDTVHAALSGRGVAVGRDVTLEVAPRSEPGRRYCV